MSDRTADTAHRRSLATAVLLTAVLCAPTPYARADDYPSRAITLIVPYPAGGRSTPWRAWSRQSSAPRSASR
jgi:hypothetical protein